MSLLPLPKSVVDLLDEEPPFPEPNPWTSELTNCPPQEDVWKRFMRLVHLLIGEGWNCQQLTALLHTSETPLAAAIRRCYDRGDRTLDDEVKRRWRTALSHRQWHSVRCGQARWVATQVVRGGKSAATDLAVLLGLYTLAEERGRLELQLGVRDIAEAAGVGYVPADAHTGFTDTKTVRRALRRLDDDGIVGVDVADRDEADCLDARTCVTLPHPELLATRLASRDEEGTTPYIPPACGRLKAGEAGPILPALPTNSTWSHVVWEGAALGMNAARVWHYVRDHDEWTRGDVAAALGVTERTVANHLKGLASHGLYDVERRICSEPERLDVVAEALGITRRRATRSASNVRERKMRRTAIEERRSQRGVAPSPRATQRSDCLALFPDLAASSATRVETTDGRRIDPRTGEILQSREGDSLNQPSISPHEFAVDDQRVVGEAVAAMLGVPQHESTEALQQALDSALRHGASTDAPDLTPNRPTELEMA